MVWLVFYIFLQNICKLKTKMIKCNNKTRWKMDKIYNVDKINQMRCIAGLVMSSIMAILAFLALVLNIANFFRLETP